MSATRGDRDGAPTYPIASVDSAFRLLVLVGSRPNVRVADASVELGVARSTAHRLMQMLVYHGFAVQVPGLKTYTKGPAMIELALQVIRGMDVKAAARPVLEELSERLQETIHLISPHETGTVICLDSVESPRALRVSGRMGMVLPAYACSSGRVFLATLSHEELCAAYPNGRLKSLTTKTVHSLASLEQELEGVRTQGYAVQSGEMEDDIGAISVPVRDRDGRVVFAITVAFPITRMQQIDVPAIARQAMRSAQKVAALIPDRGVASAATPVR